MSSALNVCVICARAIIAPAHQCMPKPKCMWFDAGRAGSNRNGCMTCRESNIAELVIARTFVSFLSFAARRVSGATV